MEESPCVVGMGIKPSSVLNVRVHPRLTLPALQPVQVLAGSLGCTRVLFTSRVQCARPRLAPGDFIRDARCCLPRDLLCTGEVACGPRSEHQPGLGVEELVCFSGGISAEWTLAPDVGHLFISTGEGNVGDLETPVFCFPVSVSLQSPLI